MRDGGVLSGPGVGSGPESDGLVELMRSALLEEWHLEWGRETAKWFFSEEGAA